FLTTLQTAQAAGYRPVPIPVDAQGPTVAGLRAALDDGIRAVVVTPRAQNPTGAVISHNRADELSALLCDYPYVLIIEDDHFWHLPLHPYRSMITPNLPRWALILSVLKSLVPHLRVWLVAAHPLTSSRLGAHILAGAMWVSHILQRLTYLLTTNPD